VTVIAIDGPAGAGKSSVARAVAHALGFRYVDTGAMYRAIALAMLERGIEPSDQNGVESLARAVAPTLTPEGGPEAQAGRLRDPDVGTAASEIAKYPGVRRALAARQRNVAGGGDVVMEGRDIGTVIAPDAEVKLFLTASRSVRARRRQEQLGLPSDERTIAAIEKALGARDHADSVRPESPMKRAPDAVQIDSSDRDLAAVVAEVLGIVEDRLGPR
jgi:cytidylate kinase